MKIKIEMNKFFGLFIIRHVKYNAFNILFKFTGNNCEDDYDGCEATPCSVGRNCSDTNADYHKDNPDDAPYTCSPCPNGFTETDNKCIGMKLLSNN
jgi:hypothetical protein